MSDRDLAALAGRLADLAGRPLSDHPAIVDEVLAAIAAELDELAGTIRGH